MRKLDSLTPAEIREAVAALAPEYGDFEPYQLLDAVAERLGTSRSDNRAFSSTGYGIIREQERYYGRVKRASDLLAAMKVIVKVSAGERLPSGQMQSAREVHYYTPDAFKQAKARGEQEQADRIAVSRRWADIAVRLANAGLVLSGYHTLSQEEWETLLDRAGL